MSLKQALRTILAADATLTGLVGDRIRPDQLAQGDRLPAVVIEVTADVNQESLDDDDSTGEATVNVLCCAHTSSEAEGIAVEVRRVLAGFRGTSAGIQLDPVRYVGTERDHEPPADGSDEADWFFVVPQFAIWHRA